MKRLTSVGNRIFTRMKDFFRAYSSKLFTREVMAYVMMVAAISCIGAGVIIWVGLGAGLVATGCGCGLFGFLLGGTDESLEE